MPATTRPPSPRARRLGLTLALISALAFGGSGPAAKPLIEAGLEPLHVTWLRVAGAALVMLPLAWRHRALVRRRPALLAGFGLLAVAGVQACYFAALSRIPVGVALLIEYLAPALVLGWVRFVQRRPVTRAAGCRRRTRRRRPGLRRRGVVRARASTPWVCCSRSARPAARSATSSCPTTAATDRTAAAPPTRSA